MISSVRQKIRNSNLSLKISILILVFATGSWVEINGIWVELPVIVPKSPEQWKLPSYLTVVIQIANIGPLLYILSNRYCSVKINERPVIYVLLAIGVIGSFLLAFTWDITTTINNKVYSGPLILISFFLSLVDCTSSVTFLPFMAYFPKEYMTVFYMGEGMSGFLPSVVALIQGVGEQPYRCKVQTKTMNITSGTSGLQNVTEIAPEWINSSPLFSARVFFIFVSIMMMASLTCYTILVRILSKPNKYNVQVMYNNHATCDIQVTKEKSVTDTPTTDVSHSWQTTIYLLLLTAVINGLSNGVLPSILSYACLPYERNIYHLTSTLSAAVNPIFCFMYFIVSVESVLLITVGAVIYALSAAYTITVASSSPCPHLLDDNVGGILILVITVLGVGVVSYLKTAISSKFRSLGYNALLWNGVFVQIGSLIGACTIFPLVNEYDVFKQSVPCQTCH